MAAVGELKIKFSLLLTIEKGVAAKKILWFLPGVPFVLPFHWPDGIAWGREGDGHLPGAPLGEKLLGLAAIGHWGWIISAYRAHEYGGSNAGRRTA